MDWKSGHSQEHDEKDIKAANHLAACVPAWLLLLYQITGVKQSWTEKSRPCKEALF